MELKKQIDEIINYWLKSSEEDLKTAKSLFVSKRYQHCLFFCHLFVEKILKALVVKSTSESAPYLHRLSKLAKITGIEFTNKQIDLLDELTAFNIEARYDNYKFQLYKKANRSYTQNYLKKSKEIYSWLRKKI